MKARFYSASMLIASLTMLSPAAALAGGLKNATDTAASEVTSDDVLNAIDPAMSPDMGKGGGGDSSMIYPYPSYGGITVDASITQEVTPDFVALNAYCDTGKMDSRDTIRTTLADLFTKIKALVGTDGRVRRMGTVSIYPYYDSTGSVTSSYTGNLSVMIRLNNLKAAERIMDGIENLGCTASWDVRLQDTQTAEMKILDKLVERLNSRKKVFEKLLGKKLTNVTGASFYTWADGYGTYEPETNTVEATTTLSVTFELRGRSTLPRSTTTPRG